MNLNLLEENEDIDLKMRETTISNIIQVKSNNSNENDDFEI